MDNKKIFEKFDDQNAFIKVTSKSPVESSHKAVLNRKGNQKFNEGDVEAARRIFMTTGYSDGLSRVGDYYRDKQRPLEALRMYYTAPDKNKSQPLIEKLAVILQAMIKDSPGADSVTSSSFTESGELQENVNV
ncbi:MAG: hypothetical protein FWC17_00295 [Treponema sp.]|nr:hypothetical protein [Treponema sp.]